MQYRSMKDGTKVSVLGFGCMRFQRKGTGIDYEEAEKEILLAIDGGINYYDTAYIYPGSEALLGEVLHRNNMRDRVYIATKLPHYMIKTMEGVEKTFQEELSRLQTDYIDYYLMHMLDDVDTWNKLVEKGMVDWIKNKIETGAIRNIGFSFHGQTKNFIELIDAYDWDFCQIQYNYMDETSQAGVEGLKYAASKNIPVIIMEGLRGGRLVNLLPDSAKELIRKEGRGQTPADIAFKWLFNQPEITVVLSGMNTMEMVQQNLELADREGHPGCMTEDDEILVEGIKSEIKKSIKVGCTGCGYCMPCPQGVDIPIAFRCYNELYTEGKGSGRKEYMQCTIFKKNTSSASQCIGCGKCEKHCPQHIEIRKELKNAARELETPVYKISKKGIQLLKLW